ncbi:MAG: hypothetical protein Q8R92_19860 [Deltaproteobacteria bacterium]|nr:hypothetical protein [Deltaproteobacteria bacterium]
MFTEFMELLRPLRGRAAGEFHPRAGVALNLSPNCALRPIWEVEPEALLIVFGLLLRRDDLEALFGILESRDLRGMRADALFLEAVERCSQPCPFAEAVERLLDHRTGSMRERMARCPFVALAEWWAAARENASGEHLAAFCWALVTDRRWIVQTLKFRVLTELWLRALQILGGHYTSAPVDAARSFCQLGCSTSRVTGETG